jgi:hypothetical protein
MKGGDARAPFNHLTLEFIQGHALSPLPYKADKWQDGCITTLLDVLDN